MIYNYNLITLDLNNKVKSIPLSLVYKDSEQSTIGETNQFIVDYVKDFQNKTIIQKLSTFIETGSIDKMNSYTKEVFTKMYNKETIVMMDFVNSFIYLFNLTSNRVTINNFELALNENQVNDYQNNNFVRIPITEFSFLKQGLSDLMKLYGEDYKLESTSFLSFEGTVNGFIVKEDEVLIDTEEPYKVIDMEDEDIVFVINGGNIYSDILMKTYSKLE